MEPMSDSWISWAVGALASVIGIGEWIRRSATEKTIRDQTRTEMLTKLDAILAIDRTLSEVLHHPDESKFSIAPAMKNQDLILEKLERILAAEERFLDTLQRIERNTRPGGSPD